MHIRGGDSSTEQGSIVKKSICLMAALIALCGLQSRSAMADGWWPLFRGDPAVTVSGAVVGGASVGGYYAIAPRHHHHQRFGFTRTGAAGMVTVGCMALSPMVAAAVVDMTEHRELTSREVLTLMGDCIIPFAGTLFWNAAFDAHPEWEHKVVRAKH